MMRINQLANSPDRAGRYKIVFEDGSSMRLYRQTVEDHGLYPGKEMTDEEVASLRVDAGKMSAKMRAVRIVSATNVSRRDLEDRRGRKGEDLQQARDAVRWMEDLHLVDDRNTAEQIVHSCISKGYGIVRAKQALYEKKIPRSYWEDALADYPDQSEKIGAFLRSRLDGQSDQRDVKRAVDALLRRGHSYSSIRRELDRLDMDRDEFLED